MSERVLYLVMAFAAGVPIIFLAQRLRLKLPLLWIAVSLLVVPTGINVFRSVNPWALFASVVAGVVVLLIDVYRSYVR